MAVVMFCAREAGFHHRQPFPTIPSSLSDLKLGSPTVLVITKYCRPMATHPCHQPSIARGPRPANQCLPVWVMLTSQDSLHASVDKQAGPRGLNNGRTKLLKPGESDAILPSHIGRLDSGLEQCFTNSPRFSQRPPTQCD
jgi:hypothetical protein